MSPELQEGIYYREKPPIGNSFCIISLRCDAGIEAREVGNIVNRIWKRLSRLRKGIIPDLDIDRRHRKTGNLSILLGYGANIFDLIDSKKCRPLYFSEKWNFKRPIPNEGGTIIEGSNISYSEKVQDNHLLDDHVLFQFIAETGFYTTRAVVEVWKEINEWKKNTGNSPLHITGLYKGFQRADQRNWQGFHDGVSNLKSQQRRFVISIESKYLNPRDKWTLHGTYLAFMRLSIDLKKWEELSIKEQEILVGRDKLTGCPLVGVDSNGLPLKDARCPVPGTTEVIDRGNEHFRDFIRLGMFRANSKLENSHIRRARPLERFPVWDIRSSRIYRQGFEFLDSSNEHPGFTAGLNFVSFQNTPERLFRSLTYPRHIPANANASMPNFENFFSVLVAGIFLVPPVVPDEPFPGARLFFNSNEVKYLTKNAA